MNRRYQTLSLLMAATVTMAIPALASSVCACTTGNTGAGVLGVTAAVAQVTQTSPAFPSITPGNEVIKAGSPAAVTYHLAFLDRNGEQDFSIPVIGSPNPQQLLTIEIMRPDGTFIDTSDAIAVPSPNGCTTQQVVRTSSTAFTASGTPRATVGNAGIGWILMNWNDAVPNNGIVTCDLVIDFNSGGSTPIGVYTIRPGVMDGIVTAPKVTSGDIYLQPIGFGPSEDVTTTVYNLQSITTAIGNTNGTIDFGSIRPGEIALGMGGVKPTLGRDVVVTNEAVSQPVNLMVTMLASDLYQNGTVPSTSQTATIRADALAPISCNRIAIAMQKSPTPADRLAKSNSASPYCDIKVFDNIPTMFPGQEIAFNAGLLDPGVAGNNYAFAAGQYLGTLKVCLTGPGGQGDPITVGAPPVNPIPSFNYNLAQSVDDSGPVQTAA